MLSGRYTTRQGTYEVVTLVCRVVIPEFGWIGAMSAEARMAACEKEYENGIGAMSAEARMAASEKGYENRIGTLSAEARMAVRKKGDKMSIKWEKKMPEIGTPLYNWQENQLGNRPPSLNAKIWKEIEENEGSTVWSERRVKLANCIAQKRRE